MTHTKNEALDLALEAQQIIAGLCADKVIDSKEEKILRAAINQALAAQPAPVQEPVAWYRDEGEIRIYYESKCWDDATPLYTTQPAAQRQWVSLTDSEIKRIGKLDLDSNYFGLWYDFAKAIEQRLKEKNT